VRRILFVANGHGETAIAARIAADVVAAANGPVGLDLFPIVGTGGGAAPLTVVGPRRTMPSGGLVAMGNVRAFSRDLAAGFAGLFARQLAFLATLPAYDAIVVVGDAYALALALAARTPTVFVGTAKSVYVAPYGRLERTLLRSAVRCFVRDEATAAFLRERRVRAEAPGNAIVDLIGPPRDVPPGAAWLGVLPGSREDAYADGVRLARVVRALGERPGEETRALFSIAPTLDAGRFARALAGDGWVANAEPAPVPQADERFAFEMRSAGARLFGWRGDLGTLFAASAVVLGQAGTANEQAAASGIPVVALDGAAETRGGRGSDWYRMRQRRLLGDALLLVPPEPAVAAQAISALFRDAPRRDAMGAAGRARMGSAGGSAAMARAVLELVS
jgi:uncharacterized protein (TIGR03492 family)